jgi:hypothetical protein
MRETPDQACDRLAARQFGAIARVQALTAGMSESAIDYRVETGRWIGVHRGIYVVAGSPVTWDRRAMAANLLGGPGSALSHLSAAAILGLRESRPLLIHVTTPRQLHADGVRAHRQELSRVDLVRCGPLTVTGPIKTMMDLSGVLDQDRLEDCLEEALHRGLLDLTDLSARMAELDPRGRKGISKLRRLIEMRDPAAAPNETTFETLLFRTLRNAGLPLPERQFCVWDGSEPVTRLDFAYPSELLGIPADSYEWHGRRRNWEKDIFQRNRLLTLGWRLRPTTWTELKRMPERFTSDIWHLLCNGLAARGRPL